MLRSDCVASFNIGKFVYLQLNDILLIEADLSGIRGTERVKDVVDIKYMSLSKNGYPLEHSYVDTSNTAGRAVRAPTSIITSLTRNSDVFLKDYVYVVGL